tara:strand:- start:4298 stop:4741 length:444 start_codon:yes stop_codon:yes gene_type:complete
MKNNYDVLIPQSRKNLHWESEKAEALFKKFVAEGFSYDEISNNPDYPTYASAEFLNDFLPHMIDEMLKRKDIDNFLIYPMISAINPAHDPDFPTYNERASRIVEIADLNFTEKVCQFLTALVGDPPIPEDEFDRVLIFWKNKLKKLN